jgi:hypothetical protein
VPREKGRKNDNCFVEEKNNPRGKELVIKAAQS